MTDTRSGRSARGLRSDARGVTPVIGVVLLVAVGMVLLAVLQATAIPKLNAQHEFEHNQRVQTDVVRLETTVDRVAATGTGETAAVEVGLRYPSRLVFLNPPPVSGRLQTTDQRTVTVANARATGETGDYWDGSNHTFETRALVYEPDYNEWDSAPTTVYEPWAVYNRQDGATVPQTETALVDGREISLVALDGRPTRATAGTVGVNVQSVSAPVRTVTVENGADPIRITLPTEIREDVWRDLLADELDPDGTDDDRYVTDLRCAQAPPNPCGELTLTLEPGTYEFRLGKVAVGGGVAEPGAAYLTDVADPEAVSDGATTPVRVAVRDRFDNPVSGVDVQFSSPDGRFDAPVVTSDDDGRATAQFTPASSGTATITATADLDGDGTIQPEERVTLTRDVVASGGDGGGGGGGGVGQGGTETYSPSDPVRTLSTEGGLWRDVTGVSRLLLTNPRFSPTEAGQHEDLRVDQRHFRLVYGVETDTATYYVAVTEPSTGLFYKPSDGSWSNTRVEVLTERGGSTTVVSGTLDATALSEWRDANVPLDLLELRTYTAGTSAQFRERLTELKQRLRTERVDIYVADLHGRTDIEAATNGRSLAYPDAFVDADGTAELQERTAIRPATPQGNLANFVRMQQTNGEDEAQLTEQDNDQGMAIGTATYGVDQRGTTYTLAVRFRYDRGGGTRGGSSDDVTVQIVDDQGTVFQTATLGRQSANFREVQIALDADAQDYVQRTGDLYVVYRQPANGFETDLRIDYQRLRVD